MKLIHTITRLLNFAGRAIAGLIIVSLFFSPLGVLAQEIDIQPLTGSAVQESATSTETPVTDGLVPADQVGASSTESTATSTPPEQESGPDLVATTSEAIEIASTSTAVAATEGAPTTKTKFKKNLNLPKEEQLTSVRQHILDNKLPQVALDRLNAWETQQTSDSQEDGFFKKVFNNITGNTDAAREKEEAEKLIKQKPFKFEGFEGKIKTVPASSYD